MGYVLTHNLIHNLNKFYHTTNVVYLYDMKLSTTIKSSNLDFINASEEVKLNAILQTLNGSNYESVIKILSATKDKVAELSFLSV